MVQLWLTSKSIQNWRRKELERVKQILCTLSFIWFFCAWHELWASTLPDWFSDDSHFPLLEVVVLYWCVLPKAIQDSEPPRGGKHHTKDLLYFFHLILLLDISSVTKKLHRKQRILFAEHFNCCIGRPYITQIKRFDSDKSVVSSVLTFLIQVIKEL